MSRWIGVASTLVIAACASPTRSPSSPARPKSGPAAPALAGSVLTCSASLDVKALMDRHERAFGGRAAVMGALPGSTSGAMAVEGKTGTFVLSLGPEAHRMESFVAGLASAEGQDPSGPWAVGAAHGVREALVGTEASDVLFTGWLWRRGYADAGGPPAEVMCREGGRVDLRFARPELGEPVLTFDLATAALLAEVHRSPDGASAQTELAAWSPPDARGVRWPTKLVTKPTGDGAATTVTLEPLQSGDGCARLDRRGQRTTITGPSCFARADDRVATRWPASGVARIPMRFLGGELLVRARVGGHEVDAFLDSGAGITVVEAGMPAASAFVSTMEMDAQGATQKVRIGLGELPSIDVGDLHLEHVPAASVPIPALDAFGDKRPEIVLGYTLFALGAVRVDYARGEIAIAHSSEGLVAPRAKAVPMRAVAGKLVADVQIEGKVAPMELDTGNGGAFDLFARWANPNGLPGERPSVRVKGRFGAGTAETEDVFFRLERAELGAVVVQDVLAQISTAPGTSSVAGLLGNLVYARCDAVVFDHPRRTLWLEGACDRRLPDARFGWRLERKDDPAHAGHPWVVASLMPSGSAEQAGVRVGDRLLEVGGRPATLDVAPIWKTEQSPEGTKVPLTVAREGKPQRLVLELRAPLRAR